jgi:hypothetical protein
LPTNDLIEIISEDQRELVFFDFLNLAEQKTVGKAHPTSGARFLDRLHV